MFQFPAFAPIGLYIQPSVTPSALTVTPGFPIRTPQDQSLFDNSPGNFAAFHVLHRLITPRHPPYTLNSLITFVSGQPSGQKMYQALKHSFNLGELRQIPMQLSISVLQLPPALASGSFCVERVNCLRLSQTEKCMDLAILLQVLSRAFRKKLSSNSKRLDSITSSNVHGDDRDRTGDI